jgi:hypothetical protein
LLGVHKDRIEISEMRIEEPLDLFLCMVLVVVRQQAHADPGDIVVTVVDGDATIKRLVKGTGVLYPLKPESTEREYRPILLRTTSASKESCGGFSRKGQS